MKLFKSILIVSVITCNLTQVTHAQNSAMDLAKFQEKDTKKISKDSLQIRAFGNKIIIRNGIVGKKIEIYSLVGVRVKVFTIKNPNCEFDVGLAQGYYIVKIDKTVRKIALR